MKGIVFLLLLLAWPVTGSTVPHSDRVLHQDPISGRGNPIVHELSADVFAVTDLYHSAGRGFGVNAGIIFTSHSVIFVDAGMSIASAEFLWQSAAARMHGGERLYLILTHHHSDHTFGMEVLKKRGATVIAHSGVNEWLENDKGEYKRYMIERSGMTPEEGDRIFGEVVLSLPEIGISSDVLLNIDGDEIRIMHTPGHVHTELTVYHPRSRTLFTGDTVYEGSDPNTRFGGPVDWEAWISGLERLKDLEIGVLVPGHGHLSDERVIDRNIDFLRNLSPASSRTPIAVGDTPDTYDSLEISDPQVRGVFQTLRQRRTVRRFRPIPVPGEHIEAILDAARHAPTAGNQQPWRFLVVTDRERLDALNDMALEHYLRRLREEPSRTPADTTDLRSRLRRSLEGVLSAPVHIAVLADQECPYPDFAVQDATLAAGNLMNAARALGYGTGFFTTYFPDEVMKPFFRIPERFTMVCFTPIGVPEEWPVTPPKKPLAELVVHGAFPGR
jgi:glyoxylase-like metal-dependent hydrolase (beta-lactamase superfamily II)/nitroreductase